MKKKTGIFWAVLFCFLALTGCTDKKGNDVTDVTDTDKEEKDKDTADKMDTIAEKAKNDVANADEIAKENIHKAVTYIDENIDDPFKEEKVTEQLAYYGAYLKEAGSRTTEGSNHEIAKMGENVHKYIRNIYDKTETETGKASMDLKTSIHDSMAKIRDKKDNIVDDFHKTIHNTKTDNTINE